MPDDLSRNQLLPLNTVFVMETSGASYNQVAETAESALDTYQPEPHTAAGLADRIELARQRKLALKDIFTTIEDERFDET